MNNKVLLNFPFLEMVKKVLSLIRDSFNSLFPHQGMGYNAQLQKLC